MVRHRTCYCGKNELVTCGGSVLNRKQSSCNLIISVTITAMYVLFVCMIFGMNTVV